MMVMTKEQLAEEICKRIEALQSVTFGFAKVKVPLRHLSPNCALASIKFSKFALWFLFQTGDFSEEDKVKVDFKPSNVFIVFIDKYGLLELYTWHKKLRYKSLCEWSLELAGKISSEREALNLLKYLDEVVEEIRRWKTED